MEEPVAESIEMVELLKMQIHSFKVWLMQMRQKMLIQDFWILHIFPEEKEYGVSGIYLDLNESKLRIN